MQIGCLRIYKSHKGSTWVLQRRVKAFGLMAALHGGGTEWRYEGKFFKTKKAGLKYLAEHDR